MVVALGKLSIAGFRNLGQVEVEFSPRTNYLFGPNGSGKTNLLEAIHFLAIGRSFRRALDREMLGFDREMLSVAGADDNGKRGEVRFDGREKRALLNGNRVERLSDYLGWLPVVALLLEDIELVRGAPVLRRNFLDLAIAKTDRSFIGILGEYRRVLLQRNRLLERHDARTDVHEAWEAELVRTGVPVIERRTAVVGQLLGRAGEHYKELSGHPAGFSYRASISPARDVAATFRERLAATREKSLLVGHTLVGPHRDDIRIRRAERDLRRYGSVGEQRLAAIALRLAEADLLAGVRGEQLVFLMDEVASELDEVRGRRVLEMVVERGQTIYAAARRFDNNGKEFHVETGTVQEVPSAG